jgi:hypothetical protein
MDALKGVTFNRAENLIIFGSLLSHKMIKFSLLVAFLKEFDAQSSFRYTNDVSALTKLRFHVI